MKAKYVLLAVGLVLAAVAAIVINIVFFAATVEAPSTREWHRDESSRAITVSIRGDAAIVSEAGVELFTFSLLEGSKAALKQEEDGLVVTFTGDSGHATAWFAQGDPQIYLTIERVYRTLPRDAGTGRLVVPGSDLWGFGDAGPAFIEEPTSVKSWTMDPVARLKNERVTATLSMTPIASFDVEPEKNAVGWSYARVDTDCGPHEPIQIQGRLSIGEWPFYRVSSSTRGRERSVGVAVTVPDSGDYAPIDQEDFDKRLNVLVNGHSDPSDPRFGNGGLGAADMNATVIYDGFDGPDIEGVDYAKKTGTDCPDKLKSILLGGDDDGARLFSNGAAGVSIPTAKPLSSVVSGAFGKPSFDELKVYNTELAASRNPLVKPPPGPWLKPDADGGWTLSDFAVKRLTDIELLGEEASLEFVSALDAAERLQYRSWIEQKWLASGALKLNAKEYAEPGLTIVFAGEFSARSNVEMKTRTSDEATYYWWNFNDTTEFEFAEFERPPSIAWSTEAVPKTE